MTPIFCPCFLKHEHHPRSNSAVPAYRLGVVGPHHKPEDGVLNFEEEEEPELDDAAAGNEAGGDAWGAGGEANADDAWGSVEVVAPAAEANDAWVPDNDAPVAKGGW
ncbi:hypothetical protein ABEF95_015354 [Exophiala dermatitidis]